MRSRWFRTAKPDRDGLYLPGRPAALAAALHLSAPGAALDANGAAAQLDWESYRLRDRPYPLSYKRGWWVAPFTEGRGGPIGIGIRIQGETEIETSAVRAATKTGRNLLRRFLQDGRVIPLRSAGVISPRIDVERDTLMALCAALATRPSMRAHLADRERLERLIADLSSRPLQVRRQRAGVRRSTIEVLGALQSLGYRHDIGGRPLPGDLPQLDHVTDGVMRQLNHNPYTRHLSLDRTTVSAVVRRHFLEVEPWPLAALTD